MSKIIYQIPVNEQANERHKLYEKQIGVKLGTVNERLIIVSFGPHEYVVVPSTWIINHQIQ
jgi:hypothetical protein